MAPGVGVKVGKKIGVVVWPGAAIGVCVVSGAGAFGVSNESLSLIHISEPTRPY